MLGLTITPILNTEQVRQLMEQANGRPCTAQDVHNLARPGKPLYDAVLTTTRGTFNRAKVKIVVEAIARRRLASELGRISPRYLEDEHAIKCPECGDIAVRWGGELEVHQRTHGERGGNLMSEATATLEEIDQKIEEVEETAQECEELLEKLENTP